MRPVLRTAAWVIGAGLCVVLLREVVTTPAAGHKRSDLLPTYVAAHVRVEAGPDRVYHTLGFPSPDRAPADWVAVQRRVAGDAWYTSAFLYHPLYLELVGPVARALPVRAFEELVFVLNGLASAVVGWIVAGLAGVGPSRTRALAALVLGLAVPFTQAAALGQNTVIVLALALVGLRGVASGRAPTALEGAALALAALGKPWAVALFAVPVLAGHVRAGFAVAAAGLLVAEIVPRVVLDPALVAGWDRVRPMMEGASLPRYNNASLRTWLDVLDGGPPRPGPFPWVAGWIWGVEKAAAAAVAGVGLAGIVRRRPAPTDLVVGALALVLVPLGTLWTHYLTFAVPAAAVLAATRSGAARGLGVVGLAWIVTSPGHVLGAARAGAGASPDGAWATVAVLPWGLVLALGLAALWTPRAPATSGGAGATERDDAGQGAG